MDPDTQQRIVYWVDGYRVAKGEVVVGSVAFDKFDRPIAALVDDCKATPKRRSGRRRRSTCRRVQRLLRPLPRG
jgi:hypothetical protein